jgi:hypothetical protein
MDDDIAYAYAKGKLAGIALQRALTHNPQAKRPDNPYAGAYLASLEWERGFNDGRSEAKSGAHSQRKSAHRHAA